jgi:hypothetical protein
MYMNFKLPVPLLDLHSEERFVGRTGFSVLATDLAAHRGL